jgi:hypothetical protein
MAFEPGNIKHYFLSLLHHLGDLTDSLSGYFHKLLRDTIFRKKIEIWEFRLESTVNREERWIGLLPLFTGLVIVFIIMGSGLLNLFVLAVVFLVAGALVVGQKENI